MRLGLIALGAVIAIAGGLVLVSMMAMSPGRSGR